MDLLQIPTSHLPASSAVHTVGVNRREPGGQLGLLASPQILVPLPLPDQALTLTTPISRLKLMINSMVMSRKLEINSAERQREQ